MGKRADPSKSLFPLLKYRSLSGTEHKKRRILTAKGINMHIELTPALNLELLKKYNFLEL